MKTILKGQAAREKLLEGAQLVYDCVSVTLGPKSANVAVSRQWGMGKIIHDGVSIAREVVSSDVAVNMGALFVIEAAAKTVDECGDGTTTSTILSYELLKQGNALIQSGKVNAIQLRDELDAAYIKLLPNLTEMAKKTRNITDLEKIATISSTQKDIGRLVSRAYEIVGLDGIVTADRAYGVSDQVDITEGMQFDQGYASRYFVTNPDKMDATIDEPFIIVLDKKLSHENELLPALGKIIGQSTNIVVFGDLEESALAVLIRNKMEGKINCMVIRPPRVPRPRQEFLEDVSRLTGAKILTTEIGFDIKNFDVSWCGRAERVYATSGRSTIIGGRGDKAHIKKHIENLKYKRDNPENEVDREMAEERYAKMSAGIVVIRVGGKTEIIQNERLERLKDAIGATRAALEEGVVPGGGVVFLKLQKSIKATTNGAKLLRSVLDTPIKKILENAGESAESAKNIIDNIIGFSKDKMYGYEMVTGTIVDMDEKNVLDPVKVLRVALANAVSVAGSILTTEVLIAQAIEPLALNE